MIDEKKLIEELKRYDFSYMQRGDIQECLEEIIELQPKIGEWIPVSERLPNKDGLYLVVNTEYDDVDYQLKLFDSVKKMFIVGFHDRIVAWMPLPKIYEVKI